MKSPLVTVVMPAFNSERWIEASVRSVLAQTLTSLELLVVDDGSTDHTAAIIQVFGDARVRLLTQSHAGEAAASNTGLAAARGTYFTRLGSDDLWEPDFLEVQVARLEAEPQLGVVYARARVMDSHGIHGSFVWGYPLRYPDDALRSLLHDDCTSDITVVVRRELVVKVGGFDASLPYCLDWDLWLRVARVARFGFTDRVLAYARFHGGSLGEPASPQFAAKLEPRLRVIDKVFADPTLPPAARAMRPIAYRNHHTFAGLQWLRDGQTSRAIASFRSALDAGAGRVGTAVRIAGLVLLWRVLYRFAAGRWLARWQAACRHGWPMDST